MRTNLLNDLSNVVKKGTSLACSWSQVGRMSGEGAIEHPLSTHSAPFGTRWKPAGNKHSISLCSFTRLAAMVTLLLTLACGNAKAWYVKAYGPGWGGWDSRNIGTGEYTWYNVSAGTFYYHLGSTESNWSGGDLVQNKSTMTDHPSIKSSAMGLTDGQMTITLPENSNVTIKYAGSGSDWKVNVYVRPAYYFKYDWKNTGWNWCDHLYSNGDGTYSTGGQYKSSATCFNYNYKASDDGKSDCVNDISVVGSPSNGNECIFTYNPSNHSLQIQKKNTTSGTNYIYFDNTESNWSDSKVQFVIGHLSYTRTYTMTALSNTKLYYVSRSGNDWSDAAYFGMIGSGSKFDDGVYGCRSMMDATHYSAPLYTSLNLASGKGYLVSKANADNGKPITIVQRSYGNLKVTQTVQYQLSTDNGSTYSTMSSGSTPAKITQKYYQWYNETSLKSQATNTLNVNASTYSKAQSSIVYTGKVTLKYESLQSGFSFSGWYDGETQLSTEATYEYYPREDKTISARFKAKQYTITLDNNSGSGVSPTSVKATYNLSTLSSSITNPTRSGYVFTGWYTTAGGGYLIIDKNGALQANTPYTGAGGIWTNDDDVELYAGWLQVHEPGKYVTATGSGGYGKTLTDVSGIGWERYLFGLSSSTWYIGASVPVTSTGSSCILNFNKSNGGTNGWVRSTPVNSSGSSSMSIASTEYASCGSVYAMKFGSTAGQGLTFCVKGYSKFSIAAKDANASKSNNTYIKVLVNGSDVTDGLSTTDPSRREYTLASLSTTYTIQLIAVGTSENKLWGFSLKPGTPTITSSSLSGAEYAQGASATPLLVTATKLVSSGTTLSYQWYSNTTASNTGGTLIDGATSASYTPPTSSAGTTYYYCVVSETGCNSTTSNVSGAITVNAVAPTTYSVSAVTSTGTNTYGTVTASDDELEEGETTTITASPATGYKVTNWAVSGASASISPSGASNSNTTTLTMGTAAAIVTVTFGAIDYNVAYSSPSNGNYTIKVGDGGASSATKTANYGNTITLAATPSEGYAFSAWTITNTSTSADVTSSVSLSDANDKDATFTMPAYGVTVTATFAAECTDPSASLDNGAYTIGESALDLRTLWSSSNTTDDVTFTVTNANGTGATIAGDGYSFSATTAGTATISASQTSTGDYCDAAETATITVSNPTYSVTYATTGSTGGSAPTDSNSPYESGSTVTVLGNTGSLAKTGNVFLGWSDGSGNNYAPGETFTISENTTLSPIWKEGTSATITYTMAVGTSNTWSASGSSNETTGIPNAGVTITETYAGIDSGTGHKNGSTAKLAIQTTAQGATYDSPTNYILYNFSVASGYAFTPSDITIKIANVGEKSANNIKYKAVLSDASSHSISTTYICTTQDATIETFHLYNEEGVTFDGNVSLKLWAWKISSTANGSSDSGKTGSAYRLGTPLTIAGVTESTATLYDISTSATNGTIAVTVGGESASSAEEDATVTITATPDNGYEFTSWSVTKDASGDAVTVGSATTNPTTFTMPAEDVTVSATFSPLTYTITYNLNGASWAGGYSAPATYTVGTGATLPIAANMTNTGYTFDGWYANSDLSTGGMKTEVGTSEYGDKEFWAKWTENTYTVTYDKNGGSGSDMSSTVGHYVTLSNNAYTAPSGKTFVEWNTASDGTGTGYSAGEEVELTANLTLYAIWAKAVGTINWTVTKVDSKLYRGGGGYSIKAEINDASWDAAASDSSKLELSATEGVTLKNIAKSINASGKAQIVADFDITTGVNADATKITFTLSVPENNGYAPAEDDHDEDLDDCGGSGTTVSSLTSITDVGSSLTTSGANSGVYYDASSLCTLNRGSDAVYVCACSSSGSLSSKNLSYSSSYWSFGDNKVYIALYSATGFAAGDVITVVEGGSKTKVPHFAKASAATLSDLKNTDYYASKSTYELSMTSVTSPSKDNSYTYQGTIPTGFVSSNWLIIFRDGSTFTIESLTVIRGGGGIEPTLTWDADLSGGVAAYTGDADFTHTVTQNKNSFGAITYSSSNTSVVTVNATTGKVHIVGGGSATITATIAESGCYDEATASYNITVVDNCEDVAGTIGTEDLGCSGIRMTVTGHTTSGETVSYQWYKDGVSLGSASGAQTATYTATEAGEYYVIVTNTGDGHCAMASTNTVTLEASESATASKIVNQWYVKNGRRTPDVALVQTTNATGFYVKIGDDKIWDEANDVTTGFGGCPFRLGDDGIIYLNGQTSAGAAPSGLTTGDVTLKITATACGGNSSELSIVIHKQAATTAKSVAFVVDGTKGGEITAFTAAHATTSPLYVYLDSVGTAASARQFSLTGRNAYWSTVDSTLKAHYSQFDVILITDDPSTQTVPDGVSGKDAYKTKGYINALGCLIDVRPILTMEAFVSALASWKSKGINGDPTSPNPRQYAMKLDCKDHEIFNGLDVGDNVVATVEDGTTYWTVTMVNKTKSPYSGLADDEKTGGKEGIPALQGFSARDVSSLLLLGEISDGAYYAGVERQEEPAARLMLLGLNAKALPNALTEEGKIIIENALTYLLKTNMEEVDDCSNYFTGATSTDWSTATNWSKGVVPNSPMVRARILKPCEISGVTAKAAQVDIVTGGTSSKFKGGSGTCTGKLTINPTGALVVGGEIRTAEAPYYNKADLMPTDTNNLVINTNATNQAALVFNNDKGDTKATVNLYSLGRTESSAYQFQYFAVPMTYLDINPAFAGQGIYTYVWTEASGWERRGYYKGLEAFEGVGITTTFTEAKTYQMKGTLASTEEREITLTTGGAGAGQNIIGNSWLAPINIASLSSALDDDANIVDKTIYIYCTGNDGGSVGSQSTETAGQWLAIPIDASGWEGWSGLKVIPAMQGFCIIANSETTLTLNYNDHVRSTASDKLTPYLRAPKREASHEGIDLIRIRVADSQTHTDLYLFEGESFSEEFDNGWEAKYMSGDGRSANLYAETAIGPMAVVAQPEYEGTVLGFAPGKETEYTFTFSGPNKEYYLNDLKEKKSTLISEDESYMFTFEEGDTNRFYISKTPINAPSVATGTENTGDGVKARKVLVNDKLYIILNGRVYSAEGVMVK